MNSGGEYLLTVIIVRIDNKRRLGRITRRNNVIAALLRIREEKEKKKLKRESNDKHNTRKSLIRNIV